MYTDQFNHAPAELFLYTGSPRNGGAAMGSWVTYGLGSENEDLPGFVVLISGGTDPTGGKALWSTAFLPTVYQGVQCRTAGDPILYVSNPKGMDRDTRRRSLDALRQLNEYELEQFGDPETLTRISQYELAFRMQMAVPEVMDIKQEPESDPRRSTAPSRGRRRSPTTACWPGGWSSAACATSSSTTGAGTCHGTSAGNDIVEGLPKKCTRGRPADRGAAEGPEAARPARRDPGRLGGRVRPDLDERGARRLDVPRPRPPPALLHDLDGRRRASRRGPSSAPPTSSATRSPRAR